MAGPGQHHQSTGSVQGVDNDDQQAMASGLIGTFEAMPLTAAGFPTQVPSNHAARFLGGSAVTASAQLDPPCPPSDAGDYSLETPSALPYNRSVLLQGRPPQGTQYYYPSPMALFPEPRPANAGLRPLSPEIDIPQTPTKVFQSSSVPHTPSDQNSSPGLLLSSPGCLQSPGLLLDSHSFPHFGLFKDQLQAAPYYLDIPQPSQVWMPPTNWEILQARHQHNLRMAEASALLDLPVDDPFTWAPPSSSPATSPSAFLGSPGDSHQSFSSGTFHLSPSDPDNHFLTPPESPSEPWFSAQQPSARTARQLFTKGKPSFGLWPAQADLLEKYLAATAHCMEDEQTKKYQDPINRRGGKGKMNPMAPPFEPLQVYLGQIPPDPGSDRPGHAANNTSSVPRTPSPNVDKKKGKGKRKRLASSPETPANGSDKENGNDADRHVHKGKGRAASAASVEELPRTPSYKHSGKERAISISSGDEAAPSTRLDKGKGRALPAFHPDGDESFAEHFTRAGPLEFLEPGVVAGIINSSPHKGSSFPDELFAAGDAGTSTSVPACQPHVEPSPPAARYFVGQPSAGEPSGYNTATSCSRDRSPAFAGGSAPSAGYACGGYTTVHLHDTTVARDPPVSRSVPAMPSASNTSTAAAPSIQDTSSAEPLSAGLSLFAPPGKGPFYTPPPGRRPIPMFEFGSGPSPGFGFGSSASPFVVDDASSHCGGPSQQAGLPTEMTASFPPRGRNVNSQLGASSSTPIVIDDGTSQTESIVPIDLDTPSPPPDATVSCTCVPCAWCARRPQAPATDDPSTDAAAQPSALVVNGSSSHDEAGSGSRATRAALTSLAQAALSDLMMYHNEVPTDSSPAPAPEPEPQPVPERTPLEVAIERQRSRALRAKPKYSSPLRFSAASPSADWKNPGPPGSTGNY